MKQLTEKEWASKALNDDNGVIIDVRSPQEWNEGVIEGVDMLLNIFDQDLFLDTAKKLDKNKNYYVYCRSGARSAQACQVFNQLGIENTYNLMGGIMGWTGPVVAPSL